MRFASVTGGSVGVLWGEGGRGVYGGAAVADEDFCLNALGDDTSREDEVVEGEGGCPCAGNGYRDVSL